MEATATNGEASEPVADPGIEAATENPVSSVKGQKKQEKWRRIKDSRVLKRRQKKAIGNANTKAAVATVVATNEEDPENRRHSKKFLKRLEKERLEAVMEKFNEDRTGFEPVLHVCIDLQFEILMSDKELSHLARQLSRVYGSNRTSSNPALISVTSLVEDSRTMRICQQKSDGFANYIWHSTSEPVTSAFDETMTSLIYLTPDSPNVLESLEPRTVYVIGGLVDDSIKKNSSSNFAGASNISTARLPIEENAIKLATSCSFKKVLAINQVFDILMKYRQCCDWKEALKAGLPKRFGFEIQ